DVAKIAVPEVADVRLRERFTGSVAAAWIRFQDEIPLARQNGVPEALPLREECRRRAAVHCDDERVLLRRIEVLRVQKESLDRVGIRFPVPALRLAQEPPDRRFRPCLRWPRSDRSGKHFLWMLNRLDDRGR